MATSGRGSGVVGYNVQVAVDTEHHLIVTHDAINIGNDRGQLARMSKQAKQTLGTNKLDVIADRGYFDGQEILACAEAGITVTLPKPMTQTPHFGRYVWTVWASTLSFGLKLGKPAKSAFCRHRVFSSACSSATKRASNSDNSSVFAKTSTSRAISLASVGVNSPAATAAAIWSTATAAPTAGLLSAARKHGDLQLRAALPDRNRPRIEGFRKHAERLCALAEKRPRSPMLLRTKPLDRAPLRST